MPEKIRIVPMPGHALTLESLVAVAGMSRGRFANTFKAILQSMPGYCLCQCRLALAQQLLSRDTPLKRVAVEAGYGSPATLTRAFKAHLGHSSRVWAQAELAAARA